jgi:hypothetical protein
MNEPLDPPIPYQVVYSGRVRAELRKLGRRAHEAGLGPKFVAAFKELDRRLRIFPQFGQPIRDSKVLPMQEWIGVVESLFVRYVLYEEKRLVIVSTSIIPMPDFGLG